MPSDQRKTILITGATDGIGQYTAEVLVSMGHEVVIAARNADKLEKTVEAFRRQIPDANVEGILLDLADLEKVRQAAEAYRSRFGRLDVLINNAGLITSTLQKTAQGYEMQFGVNHLGHFLLTLSLMDLLEAAAEPRVVHVSSHAHYGGKLDFDNLRGEKPGYNGFAAYAQSKLANVLFSNELARRHPRVSSNALHPGPIRTRFGNKPGGLFNLVWAMLSPFLWSVEQGAQTSIRLATDPALKGVTGQYFDPRKGPRYPSRTAQDAQLAQNLWAWSLEAVAPYLHKDA